MKTTVQSHDFIDAFRRYDRYDQFGYAALHSLFNYLEQYEEDTGEEIELDVIALCCDYSVSSVETIAQDYRINIEGLDDEEARQTVLDYLNDNTTVIDDDCEGSILYCSTF